MLSYGAWELRFLETERKLFAVMLADVAGYSKLMERDEERTYRRMQALRERTIFPKVTEYGGRVIKTTGDGFLAIFPSATACLGCGITIQRLNVTQELAKDPEERFRMRIGVNVGDIIMDGDDISGDGVNIAARLEPLAPLDGICISGSVRDQVREDLGVVLEDLGDQSVKNISRPIRAFRISLADVEAKVGLVKADRRPKAPPRRTRGLWIVASIAGAALAAGVAGFVYLRADSRPQPPLVLPSEATIRAAAAAIEAPLPDKIYFRPVTSDVPRRYLEYVGAWSSEGRRWNGAGRRFMVLVEAVTPSGRVIGQTAESGPTTVTSNQNPAAYYDFVGTLSDHGLEFMNGPFAFQFALIAHDELAGELNFDLGHGKGHASIILTRLK